ncbi:hypothetical protein [Flexithrix dorotheae]|uniref:hypothetical protein n=1 Tax=Flexithrix dorotheae TaxID=70993 RepID=UPI00036A08FD|nr:hypothetical protein [Flexithrix dorotheae]
MYKEFLIPKKSGTYSEMLEVFGLGNLIDEVLTRLDIGERKITFEDMGLYYIVSSDKEITNKMLEGLTYFPVVKFLINKSDTFPPEGISIENCFNYPEQKAEQDLYKKEYENIDKDKKKSSEQKKAAKQELAQRKLSEFGKKLDKEYDVYRELIKNPYSSFVKLFDNFHENQQYFPELIKEILSYYSKSIILNGDYKLADEKPTSQQLFNPNQGKGLNKAKANNASMGNQKSFWVAETMKISGALSMMSVQYVKVGSGYDLKIYVPEFRQILHHKAKELLFVFKKYLKSAAPIKLDILNLLDITIYFIELTPEYNKGKVKNTIQGFHTVYQKDLGQNKAVANISFMTTPDFVEYTDKKESKDWIRLLKEQRNVISGIEEVGDSIKGLQLYRSFLGAKGRNALNYFSNFSFWYASYLMQALDNEKFYVKPFHIETLNIFYKNMTTQEINLSEIIQNEGFKAIAQAIRKSTVSLQYTPKENRKFEIRYGLAQQLQNKSKSKESLATFIGEFIGTYNAETGRNAEKNNGKAFRTNVKDEELLQFFSLLDKSSPRLIGALLASYGFALNKKESQKEEVLTAEEIDN